MGGVFYPCLELGNIAGNLLEEKDLTMHRKNGSLQFGPEPSCDTRCHSACALGFSLILEYPMSMVDELFSVFKGWLARTQKLIATGAGIYR